ncbi:MAG: tetratricopeptide repeat protein [Candidatus Omnitrophota bacterium]
MKIYHLSVLILNFFLAASFQTSILGNSAFASEDPQAQELFLVSEKAFDDGFYDVAVRYIEQFLQKFPSSEYGVKARLLLGQCYFFKNQYLESLEIFQSLEKNPDLKDAILFWMGETYFKGSDHKRAQSYYQQVISQYPQSTYVPQAYYSLGWSFFEQGNYEQAIIHFEKLITDFPDHVLTEDALFKSGESNLNLSNFQKSIENFEQYVALYPKSTRLANAFFYLAESYYYFEDYLKSNTFYAKASELSDDPNISLVSTLSMGWIYIKLKKLDLAGRYFEEAASIAQEHEISQEEVFLGKGAFYAEMHDYNKALEQYEQFLKIYPGSSRIQDAIIGKANAYYLLQRYDDAIAIYQMLLADKKISLGDDLLEKAYYGIAWSYLKKGNLPAAIETFEAILGKSTNNTVKSSALSQIGDAYQDAKELTRALSAYDRILKEYPQSLYADYAQFQQGITLLKLGKFEPAKLSFQSLRTNFPTSKYIAESHYYLGFAYFQNEEWGEAVKYIQMFLNDARANNYLSSQANYILALSYFHQNNFEEALQLFRKIVKELKDQPSIQQTAEVFIGKTLYGMGKPGEAVKHFTQICQLYSLSEAHQDSLIWLGEYYLQQMDFNNAVHYLRKFTEIFPTSNKINLAFFELGQCYQGLKKLDQALGAFNSVKPEIDQEIYAKAQLAIAEIFSEKSGSAKALQAYQTIAEKIPEYQRDALLQIGRIHEQEDRPQNAIDAYLQALKSTQGKSLITDAELFFLIADNYELLNDFDKAVEEYFKIPYLFQDEIKWGVKAYLRVARIMENQENWEQAKIIYQKIVDLDVEETKYARERLNWINANFN